MSDQQVSARIEAGRLGLVPNALKEPANQKQIEHQPRDALRLKEKALDKETRIEAVAVNQKTSKNCKIPNVSVNVACMLLFARTAWIQNTTSICCANALT